VDTGNREPDRQQESGKLPVPAASAQEDVTHQLEDVFRIGEARTKDEKVKLAKELLEVGLSSDGTPTERFVILRKAIDLAANAGDSAAIIQAVDAINEEFEVDSLEVKIAFLAKCSDNVRTAQEIGTLVEAEDLR
jgi:hypothetical protein